MLPDIFGGGGGKRRRRRNRGGEREDRGSRIRKSGCSTLGVPNSGSSYLCPETFTPRFPYFPRFPVPLLPLHLHQVGSSLSPLKNRFGLSPSITNPVSEIKTEDIMPIKRVPNFRRPWYSIKNTLFIREKITERYKTYSDLSRSQTTVKRKLWRVVKE